MSTSTISVNDDVKINVSQAQVALANNLKNISFVTPVSAITTRVQYFTTYEAALATTTPGSSVDYAMQAFFDQSPNPAGICIGQLLSTDESTTAAFLAEIVNIQQAAIAAGLPCYGWALDKTFRDSANQAAFAAWIQANGYVSALVTNSVNAYSSVDTTNLTYEISQLGGVGRARAIYHDNAEYYPDISALALMLATDYTITDSTLDLQYKDLPGIPPINPGQSTIETILAELEARYCSTFVLQGNGNRCFQDAMSSGQWYFDSVVNVDNFQNDLQTAIFNNRLQYPKIPFTVQGQTYDVGAAVAICNQYVRNGFLAPRQVPNQSGNGFTTLPAYNIIPSPVGAASPSSRATRTSPPIQIIAYEAGSMRKITVNVSAVQ